MTEKMLGINAREFTRVHHWVAGLQWLLFMFANTVVIPISIGNAMHMSGAAITSSMQRSFFYTGFASLLQLLFGHELPIMEGQSGVWWGAILGVLATAQESGMTPLQAGGSLETGIVISGVIIVVLGWLGMGNVLKKWFTPIASSVFLMLLATELISIFMKGMLGLSNHAEISLSTSLLSIALIAIVMVIQMSRFQKIRNYSILLGIALGWVVFRIAIEPATGVAPAGISSLWAFAPWGPFGTDWGIVLTAVAAGLINASNTVATLESAKPIFHVETTKKMYQKSFLITGINTIISGFLGLVPYAPYTSSLGFLRSTQLFSRIPFAIGAILFMILGLVPSVGAFFATLPASVGDAVLLVAYLQLFGSAMQYIEGKTFDHITIFRLALPVLIGLGIFTIAPGAFVTLPAAVRPFLSNGLLVGVLIAIVFENTIKWNIAKQK